MTVPGLNPAIDEGASGEHVEERINPGLSTATVYEPELPLPIDGPFHIFSLCAAHQTGPAVAALAGKTMPDEWHVALDIFSYVRLVGFVQFQKGERIIQHAYRVRIHPFSNILSHLARVG